MNSREEPTIGSVVEPGDLFFTRGSGLLSTAIRFFTRGIGESRTKVNHVGVVVDGGSVGDAIVVEALSRVRRHRLWSRYNQRRRTAVAVYRPGNLSPEQIDKIVAEAETYVGREYGWPTIIAHFLDWLLLGSYVFRRVVGEDNYPICSWVVAHAYKAADLDFGIEARAASPDDIWDFAVEKRPDLYRQIRPLIPLLEATPMAEDRLNRWGYAALTAIALVGVPLAGFVPASIRTRWILTGAIIAGFILAAARLKTGTVLGVLLDSRKKASVSRLQLAGWTILILSAFSTAALWNVAAGVSEPLLIAIPAEIWAALGISVTSFVGSGMIKNRGQGPTLAVNTSALEARASDVLMAEAEGADGLDLGKVQMLLFTVILLIAYGAALQELLVSSAAQGAPIQAFPSVGGGMLTLLGLSHSGYLVSKTVPQQPGGNP